MRRLTLLALAVLLLTLPTCLRAQEMSKLQYRGEKFLKKGDFESSLKYFSELDSATKANDPLYDYYMGLSYFHSSTQKAEGIPHLERYLERTDSMHMEDYGHHHVYYILGKLQHLSYNFSEAQVHYNQFITELEKTASVPDKEKSHLITKTEREIEHCKFGNVAVKNPRHVIIENLGDSINTEFAEYAAIVSQDEKLLFYTSRRPDSRGQKKDKDGLYYEDIYHATMMEGSLFDMQARDTITTQGYYFSLVTDFKYGGFEQMNPRINTEGHEGSVQLYNKDSELLFYRDSDIWTIPLNDSLAEPAKMGLHINSEYHEPSVFFSYDGEKLFIVSDRPGGYGGLDIYVSTRDKEGNWSMPKNLGPNINTPYDEDAPYLDPDESTFYFSSKGHSSMGEYDIFRSTMKNDTNYTVPVNLGYPVNTPAEDIYFTMTKRYNRGYYSSSDLKGNGDIDLYRITFSDERDPVAELKGFVKQGDKMVPAKSHIKLSVKNSDEQISTETDTINGDYFLLLGHGKSYEMEVETETFSPYKHEFKIPEQKKYFQLYQEIHHIHLFNSDGDTIGQQITVFNAFGEKDSTIILYRNEDLKSKIKKIKYLLDYEGLVEVDSEVKFYMTYDSLAALMRADTNLNFNFPPNTRISFLEDNLLDRYGDSTYTVINKLPPRFDSLEKVIAAPEADLYEETVNSDEVFFIKGLFFTVQIGVYSRPVAHSVLYNLEPINSQVTQIGNIRYSTGRFGSEFYAQKRCNEIKSIGINDAFVAAYYDGRRITPEEANLIIQKFGKGVISDDIKNE